MKASAPLPLGAKLALVCAILAVAPLSVVGVIVVDVNTRTLELLSRDLQLAALDDISRSVDDTLGGAEDSLERVGRLLVDPTLSEESTVALARAAVEGDSALDLAAIYDASGSLIDIIREERAADVDMPGTLDPELRADAQHDGSAIGEVALSQGAPRVMVVVPLSVRGSVTGYVATRMLLDGIQARVEHVAAGRFADLPDPLFVVDRQGRVLAHPEQARGEALASVSSHPLIEGIDLSAPLARSMRYAGADGEELIGSIQPIQGRPWLALAQVPVSVAYASLTRVRTIIGVAVIAAAILALLVGVAAASRIVSPLRALTEFAGKLARREFEGQVEVRTRDELALLGSAMSGAAKDLRESEAAIKREVEIRHDLGRYISPEIVERVVAREQDMSLGGERRNISVLFADVVGFTPLTEKLEPETTVAMLNELFTILTRIVFKHGGTVDKFIGDSVMALFGAPEAQEDHAERALAVAEDMLRWLETGNAAWRERYGVTIELAIGVHCGECVIGNVGSENRMEYTAIGDVVNVAARLESIARPNQILVSDAIREAASSGWEYADAGERSLPGRTKPIQLWEVCV